jgi:hypothetical protein
MRFFEIFLPAIMLVSLLTPYAHAAYGINVNIDVSGIINAVNGNTQSNANTMKDTKETLNNSLVGLPFNIFGLITGSIKNSLHSFNSSLLGLTKVLLSANPDPESMYGLWQSITIVISSFYLLVFLIIGLFFLISGNNIERREQAKNWLKNAVIMIIGVGISFYLYKLILELSTGITQFMWVTGFEQFFSDSILSGLGVIMLIVFAGTIILALTTLFLRYLFLLVGVGLFPIGTFLYLTPKFENWGKIIFNFLGVMLAMQFVDVIVLIATSQVMLQLAGNTGIGFALPLGFLIIAITNTVMIVYAIIKSAFAITNASPMIGMAIGTLSGQIGALATSLKPRTTGEKVLV